MKKPGPKHAGGRKLFEEVAEGSRAPAPQAGVIAAGRAGAGARRALRAWLVVLGLLVVAMIAVGGLTRLTDSGLSITEWRPITGAIPPLNAADWQAEFARYQQSPQFRLVNHAMGLPEFQAIYWWEWGHRQLGRLIGLVWALGLALFWARGALARGWGRRLLALGALGGLQGGLGWWMVASGLVGEMTSVASYRLALHLGLAFVILGLIGWYVLDLSRSEAALLAARRQREPKLFAMTTGLLHAAFLQILLGALVAGIDAGRSFPTWPLMGDSFFPADAFYVPDGAGGQAPIWRAFFENPGLVQFIHRMMGYLVAGLGLACWLRARQSPHGATRQAYGLMALMLAIQIGLGIVTVLHGAPLGLGLAHQLGAVVLWGLILRARHGALYPTVQSLRG